MDSLRILGLMIKGFGVKLLMGYSRNDLPIILWLVFNKFIVGSK